MRHTKLTDNKSGRNSKREDATHDASRRQFIKLAGVSGFAIGLAPISVSMADNISTPAATLSVANQPSEFLHIATDGKVTIQINRLEFGQGTHTGLARILADELDADWTLVEAQLAKAGEAFKDPVVKIQYTGSSSGVRRGFTQYRELGARARAMLVSAAAKRWKVAESQVKTANGVLFGPGGKQASYGELSEAAMALPVPTSVTLKTSDQFRFIGESVQRLDTVDKSTGQQTFGLDKSLPNMKTVLIARPPNFGGSVASFDADAAFKINGVDHVMQVELDYGATGVAVVADGFWQAKMGRDALEIEWISPENLPDSKQLKSEYDALLDKPGLPEVVNDKVQMSGAAQTMTADYSLPYLAHTPLEPLNAVMQVTGTGGKLYCEVWSGTQFQTFDQGTIARVLGLKTDQVTLHTMFAGGGFGRRGTPTSDCLGDTARVMKAWLEAGRVEPLKLVWSREDDVRGGYYRPLAHHRAKVALDKDGRVKGWQHRVVSQSLVKGTALEGLMKDGIDPKAAEGIADTEYPLPISVDVHHPEPSVPVLWWRSVGHTHTAYVMETMIDQIARETKQDPVALRRELLKDRPRHMATIDLAVRKSGYGKRKLPEGRAHGVAIHKSFNSVVMHIAEVSIDEISSDDKQIVVHHVTSAIHCNTAVNPLSVEAQIQGSVLMGIGTTMKGSEITLTNGVVDQSNFHDYILPRMPDMPTIDVHIVPSQDPPSGVGEPGLPPIAPAIANAVLSLTGKPLLSLPFSLS